MDFIRLPNYSLINFFLLASFLLQMLVLVVLYFKARLKSKEYKCYLALFLASLYLPLIAFDIYILSFKISIITTLYLFISIKRYREFWLLFYIILSLFFLVDLYSCLYSNNFFILNLIYIILIFLICIFVNYLLFRYFRDQDNSDSSLAKNFGLINSYLVCSIFTLLMSSFICDSFLANIIIMIYVLIQVLFIIERVLYISIDEYHFVDNESSELLEEQSTRDDSLLVDNFIRLLNHNPEYVINGININDAALFLKSNRTYLSKAINNICDMSFKDMIKYNRLKLVCSKIIQNEDITIPIICENCGFSSYSSACNAFKLHFGVTPTIWAKEVKEKLNNNEDVKIEDFFE